MNALDIAIIAILLSSVVYSTFRGLIEEIFALLALLVGFVVALKGYPAIAPLLTPYLQWEGWRAIVAFTAVFVAVAGALTVVGILLKRLLRAMALGWLDRLGGAAFGFAKGAAVVMLVTLLATAFLPADTEILRDSTLAPMAMNAVDVVVAWAPEKLSGTYQEKREQFRAWWAQAEQVGDLTRSTTGATTGTPTAPPTTAPAAPATPPAKAP